MAKKNYVNNKRLFEVMVGYHTEVAKSRCTGSPKPPVPNYVGECLMLIASKLSNKPQFWRYSYKDEMILEGITNCLQYIDNFNPEKSNNPFAYFTQIIKNAFIRKIENENRRRYNNYKMQLDTMSLDEMKRRPHIAEFVRDYEERQLTKKKAPAKIANTVTTFFVPKKDCVS
jgi:hypothetical protein